MEPADAHPLHHNEGDRLPGDGAREHTGGVERRGCGARSRRPFPGRLHGAEQRRLLRERRAAAAVGPGPGSFDATATPIAAWGHVASDIADADLAERLAKALVNATTGFRNIPTISAAGFEVRKIAVGTVLLSVMRTRNHALTVVPKMPAEGEDAAIQTLLGYLYERPIVAPTAPPTGAAPAARMVDAGAMAMALSPEVLMALRPAQAEPVLPTTGSDKIVLGKAPTTDGTLKRPAYCGRRRVLLRP